MAWDSVEAAYARLRAQDPKHWQSYLGFYSSHLGGFFREPWAMMIPMDDHGFHRGDGVFEAARIVNFAYIDLDAHLARLQKSAAAIGMTLPKSIPEIKEICVELARRARPETGALRLYITRGPGGFSPSVAEVTGPQLYAALTTMKPPAPETYKNGVRAMISTVPAKEAFWSQIKSCNYLQNVLMKKECLEKGFDFAVSLNEKGRVSEGATENILLVTKAREILVPSFDYTLRGTTVLEVLKLAEELLPSGQISGIGVVDVFKEDLLTAVEAAFVGTTLGVLPVASIDQTPVGSGKPGAIATFLHQRLMQVMATEPRLRTVF